MTDYVVTPLSPDRNAERFNIVGGVAGTLLGTYTYTGDVFTNSYAYVEYEQAINVTPRVGGVPVPLAGLTIVGWKIRIQGYGGGTLDWRMNFSEPDSAGTPYFAIGSFDVGSIPLPGDVLNQTVFEKVITIEDCFFGTPSNPSGYLYSLEHGLASLQSSDAPHGFFMTSAEVKPATFGGTYTLTAFELILYTRSAVPPKRVYPRPVRRAYPPPSTRQAGRRTGPGSIL